MQFNEICSLPQVINRNIRKVDLQAFTYVFVLSETQLFTKGLPHKTTQAETHEFQQVCSHLERVLINQPMSEWVYMACDSWLTTNLSDDQMTSCNKSDSDKPVTT